MGIAGLNFLRGGFAQGVTLPDQSKHPDRPVAQALGERWQARESLVVGALNFVCLDNGNGDEHLRNYSVLHRLMPGSHGISGRRLLILIKIRFHFQQKETAPTSLSQ